MNFSTSLRTMALVALPALTFVRCGGEQKIADAPSSMPSAEPPTDQNPELDGGTAQTAEGVNGATSTEGTKPSEPKPEALSDAQIAAITEAANSAEIAQGKVAQARSKDAAVKTFAAMMITHHGETVARRRQ